MEHEVTHKDKIAVIKINSERGTAKNALDLRETIDQQINQEVRNIVVDMNALTFVDSNYLGSLVAGLKNTIKAGGDLRLVGFQQSVKTMFELTRLYNIFRIYDTEDEAVASFEGN